MDKFKASDIRRIKGVLREWDANVTDSVMTGNKMADILETLVRMHDPSYTRGHGSPSNE